jgi:RNA polymerase sigma-70 factor, ECF subfamily
LTGLIRRFSVALGSVDPPADDPPEESRWRPNPAEPPDVSDPVMTVASEPAGVVPADHGRRATASGFDELFDAHYQRLVRALTVVAGDREQAADAVQEAFVKAHLRWRRISTYDDPIGWVRRVAINELRDEHRRTARKRRAVGRLATTTRTVVEPPEVDEIGRLLATLPRQQRAAIALFYVDGLSVAEIATALGVAEGSVKSNLHDGRRRLRAVIDEEAGWERR